MMKYAAGAAAGYYLYPGMQGALMGAAAVYVLDMVM